MVRKLGNADARVGGVTGSWFSHAYWVSEGGCGCVDHFGSYEEGCEGCSVAVEVSACN